MGQNLTKWLFASTAFLAVGIPAFADAQTTDGKIDTVVVTARKRSEDSLKVPIAVTAFSAKSLEARGILSLADVAQFTPGLTDQQTATAGSRSDRSFQALIIRGMNPSGPSSPTTSTFINGTPISSPDMLSVLSDVDHVEVLKGPQSAYFGRQTFAGAINVATTSAPNVLTGNMSLGYGTRRTMNFSGNIGGPIIADKLMVTVGANYVAHDGSYQNAYNPGQTLGDQSTRSFHIGITAKPIENLTLKFYGLWMQDRDGPSATGILLGADQPGLPGTGQGNCLVNGAKFFCGTLPGLTSASPAQIDTITAAESAFLHGTSATIGGVIQASDPVKHFGLKRDAYHNDFTATYEMPNLGLTLTYLGAYNEEAYSELSDLSNLDNQVGGNAPTTYTGFPFIVEGTSRNVSNEVRLTTNPNKPYRAMIGLSSVDQHGNSALGAPNALIAASGGSESVTEGVFFSLAYDILPQLTANFEGRYQYDLERTYTHSNIIGIEGATHAFLPRFTVQYRFTPDIMVYGTYSEGVNPGVFNSNLGTVPAQSLAAIRAAGFNIQTSVQPEHITNYEIGMKGRFLDGRATLSADVYVDKWTNQIDAEIYTFSATDPNSPYNVVGSPVYNPGLSPDPVNFSDNGAASIYKGVEVDGTLIPIDHVTLNVSAAYNDAKYTKFICTSCNPYTAAQEYNAAGHAVPYVPKVSVTTGIQYGRTSNFFGSSADWYVRMDYVYREGVYIQAVNSVKTPDINLVNLKAAFNFGKFGVDAYVNNLTNNKSYTTAFQSYNFYNFSPTSAEVSLPQLITVGVDLKYHF